MSSVPTAEQVLNSSSNGILVTDDAGRVTFANDRAKEILNLGRVNPVGRCISELMPTSGPVVEKCLNTGQPQLRRQIFGERLELVLNITPVWQDNLVCGVLCSFQKIQQLEILAQSLESYKRLNKELEAIFESSSDGIWVCDGHGRVISINKASEKLSGIHADDIIGKNVADIVEEGLFDQSVTLEVLETKRRTSILQYVTRTQKYLLVTGTPVFDESGDIFLVVVNERDMTQLNTIKEQMEQTRMVSEKYRDELRQLRMMELKEQDIIAENEKTREVLYTALKLAQLNVSEILILGETGTGKGLLAKFIHDRSSHREKAFIQINCAALPETLLEAELFGYEKGAFTGAGKHGKAGLIEVAEGGTLLLDEIGDLPLAVQAKLLKYLDDHELLRLGGTKARKVECIIITATNRDLERLVRKGLFRQDLFYRLNTFTLRLPPLRQRPEDIFALVSYFLDKYNRAYGVQRRISSRALEILQSFPFPGNVRELKNLLKRVVVMSDQDLVDEYLIQSLERSRLPNPETTSICGLNHEVLSVERKTLQKALARCKSTREMARYLGVSQSTVVRKLKKHGL
jgi:PAS domain S-box-containing protein